MQDLLTVSGVAGRLCAFGRRLRDAAELVGDEISMHRRSKLETSNIGQIIHRHFNFNSFDFSFLLFSYKRVEERDVPNSFLLRLHPTIVYSQKKENDE